MSSIHTHTHTQHTHTHFSSISRTRGRPKVQSRNARTHTLIPADVYESAQKTGKYKTIARTEGVSTTEIVGRMLLLEKSHLDLAKTESEYVTRLMPSLFSRLCLRSHEMHGLGSFVAGGTCAHVVHASSCDVAYFLPIPYIKFLAIFRS